MKIYDSIVRMIIKNKYLSKDYYLENNGDVREAKLNPLEHFIKYGEQEFRNPSEKIDILVIRTIFPKIAKIIRPIMVYKFLWILDPQDKYNKIRHDLKNKFDIISTENNKRIKTTMEITKTRWKFRFSKIRFLLFLVSGEKLIFKKSLQPKFSIIVLLWNKPNLSFIFFRELIAQKIPNTEIIIVDNGSKKMTKMLTKRIYGCKLIENTINEGYAKGVNKGIKNSGAEYIVLMNNDILPDKNWYINLNKNLDENNANKIIGAKIIGPNGLVIENGSNIWGDGTCSGISKNLLPSAFFSNRVGKVDYVSGAFMCFPRKVFDDLVGFDEDYFPAYYEDSDFCLRASQLGFSTYVDPSIKVYHKEHSSSKNIQDVSNKIRKSFEVFEIKNKQYYENHKSRNNVISNFCTNNRRILIMDSIPPVPNLGRGAPRQNSILRVLSDLDFEITFLYRQGEIVAWNEVLDKIPMGGLELVGPLNDVLLKVFFESRKELYETILVSRIENLIWLFKNNLTENKNIIFDFEAVIEKDLAHLKIKYPSIFDQVKNLIFVNNRDLKLFQKYFDINISNHIIGHYFSNTSKVSIIGNSKIITLGNFSDPTSPNFEMLDWLIKNVNWSESRKLNVFGDINQNLVNNNPNIIFHGKVEKEIDVFRDARIFVSPTFNSNGIPFKLDLAGSFGIPSIISSDLANKLSWEIGVDCLAADTPLEFVSCIDSLLEDNKLSEKISNNIYNKVSGNSYEKLKEKLTFI